MHSNYYNFNIFTRGACMAYAAYSSSLTKFGYNSLKGSSFLWFSVRIHSREKIIHFHSHSSLHIERRSFLYIWTWNSTTEYFIVFWNLFILTAVTVDEARELHLAFIAKPAIGEVREDGAQSLNGQNRSQCVPASLIKDTSALAYYFHHQLKRRRTRPTDI